jgi:hypothetical protein
VVIAAVALALLLSIAPQRNFPALHASPRPEAPYALIFGTAWGPDNRPLYGVKVTVRRISPKKKWELASDHRGEFAQRVAPGPADYEISCEPVRLKDGKRLIAEPVKIHVDADERQDIGLHLK